MRVRILCVFILSLTLASPSFASTPDAAPTPARVAFPGGLDRTFGNAGRAPAPADDRILLPVEWEAVAIQPDGEIVVVGSSASGDLVVARYDASGVLDPGFGSAGIATPILPHGGRAKDLALTDAGEIVVVGVAYRDVDTGTDVFALRLSADGSLDASFAGGVVTIDLGERDDATAVVEQSGGRILILADANRRDPAMPSGAVILLGLRNDGTLDPTFGRDGSTYITGAIHEMISAGAITREPDGRFLIAFDAGERGSVSQRLHIMRVGENGDPLQSFDVVAGQARGIGRLSDGKVIVHGYSGTGSTALFRFMGNGSLDPGFGDDGILAVYELRAGRIVVDKDDRVIVATGSELVRRHADGNLDTTFGVEGFASTPEFTGYDDVALQADGKIVAVGGGCFHDLPHGVTCITSVDRYESDRTQLCGDADANGVFSVSDGVATLRAAAGLDSACSTTVCDVDGSGSISVTDGVNVLRTAADLDALLSCGIEAR